MPSLLLALAAVLLASVFVLVGRSVGSNSKQPYSANEKRSPGIHPRPRESPESHSTMSKRPDASTLEFQTITGASLRDAQRYMQKHKRLDAAIDAFYNEQAARKPDAGPSTTKLTQLFDSYKDSDSDKISVDGTIRLCEELGVEAEDVALLSLAYELKSPAPGEWDRKGWVDGWRALGADTLEAMKSALDRLRERLASDAVYFTKVYNHTFDYVRTEGARSLGLDTAIPFWSLLLAHGMTGAAVAHRPSDGDEAMGVEEGWQSRYTEWWFEFLNAKGGKGVSKDTWSMFLEFVRTIDRGFTNYDEEAAWPSTIDDFVAFAREKLGAS